MLLWHGAAFQVRKISHLHRALNSNSAPEGEALPLGRSHAHHCLVATTKLEGCDSSGEQDTACVFQLMRCASISSR